MRFNKQELLTLGSQPAHKYEKEGVLFLKERSESFFRRSETFTERWFRLCGNLLFYLKTRDHWSEPLGVIVLENFEVSVDKDGVAGHFSFTISFPCGGGCFTLSAHSEEERVSWVERIEASSFSTLKGRMERLRNEVMSKSLEKGRPSLPTPSRSPIKSCGYVKDVSEPAICEISLACDNLKCDVYGRAPNPRVLIQVRNPEQENFIKYAVTEVVMKTSNPVFLTTTAFRSSDGISEKTELRLTVQDVRERTTNTFLTVGHLTLELGALKCVDKIRLPLTSQSGPSPQPVGFLTISSWNLEREERSSTESTPCRGLGRMQHINQVNQAPPETRKEREGGDRRYLLGTFFHRRTQSLPPKLGCKLKLPLQSNFSLLFSQPYVQTYRFHSGLGGDIFLHECMSESKLSYLFPQQLLSLWIAEEKELLQEMVGLGELREPWHSKQVQILERHLWLINVYTQAKQNLETWKGPDFRQSSEKADPTHEFVPLNLHLQRIYGQNESLHKSGFHDIFTCGAFTAYAQGYENGGLVKLLQRQKQAYAQNHGRGKGVVHPNKVAATYESVQGIKRLRKEIVERMQVIIKLAKERRTQGMHKFVEEIYQRCRLLLSICDQSLIEEAFEFFERQKLSLPSQDWSGGETDLDMVEEMRLCSLRDEGISVEMDSPSSPLRSVVELLRAKKGVKSLEDNTPDSGVGIEDIVKSFLDSPSSNYYRPSEEPEPWDLTQLNIEASVISLNSKVKVMCGQGVEGLDRRTSKTANNNSHLSTTDHSSGPGNATDWGEELRSSVKKLRLAMDGLLKTSRLAHSIFRLQEDNEKSELSYIIKYRRDVCFSHALTSLVTGLLSRLWCRKPDPTFLHVLTRLGPLVCFHSFLTYHGNEAEMFNDMIVAIEDLKTVEFQMVLQAAGDLSPKVFGSRSGLKVFLPVPESVFSLIPMEASRSFVVTPVLFNIGINEHATVAERLGNIEPQEKNNLDNFARLNEYYRRYKRLTLPVKFTSKRSNHVTEPNIDILLDKMHQELISKAKKNVEVIHLSGQISRALMGLRFTSCKSGKDRTAMSVTLEQAQILSLEYDLAEHEFKLALDAMRSEGCRRENTLKNIGQKKYAFNSLQVLALPPLYRPPPGTFGSVQS